ncbi:MAG TPA: hypothetical protein VGP87_12050, partial [Gemmatimonadales bacterium]|nr:hypothetical protein [Gemmatimonadales bacterium]
MTQHPAESPTLLGLTPGDASTRIQSWVEERGLPSYRTAQIVRRLWVAPVGAWSEASELPSGLRAELDCDFPLGRLRPET